MGQINSCNCHDRVDGGAAVFAAFICVSRGTRSKQFGCAHFSNDGAAVVAVYYEPSHDHDVFIGGSDDLGEPCSYAGRVVPWEVDVGDFDDGGAWFSGAIPEAIIGGNMSEIGEIFSNLE